jgi:acyl dehydratase
MDTVQNTRESVPGTLASLVGSEARLSRTIAESDVYSFAGITGDSHPNHTDEEYARRQGLGGRVVQGSLLVGLMAGASTHYLAWLKRPAVSYGYDRVRFIKPVRFGDTVTVVYRIVRSDDEKRRAWAEATVTNQRGETVAVGTNILHFQS